MAGVSMIAVAAYQARVNPQGGVWRGGSWNHIGGLSILAHENIS